MRGYSKKLIRSRVQTALSRRSETRDAILWDVLPDQHYCRVKIQGSNELIIARYNENWEQTPQWLKAGNAVRVVHRGGVRGYIEIVGHGQNIPTAIAGGTVTPPVVTPEDAIMSGMQAIATAPNSMSILITEGTFRISGITYSLENLGVLMAADSSLYMGTGVYMGGELAGIIELDAAPTVGQFRIDLIVVGTDCVLDYVKGTAAASPTQPATPSGHLLVCTILVPGGVTAIPQNYINREFTVPVPAGLTITIDDDELEWDETEPPVPEETDINIVIIDQYGNPYWEENLYLTLSIIWGNGELWSNESGWNATQVGEYANTFRYIDFKYRRGNLVTDTSPILQAQITLWASSLIAIGNITLLDSTGNVM
jgi:hypothetical protein